MATLLAEFNTYLDQEHADPTANSVGYTQVPLWLSQDELAELIDEVRGALMARRDNGPAPDRSPYLVSPILSRSRNRIGVSAELPAQSRLHDRAAKVGQKPSQERTRCTRT